MTDGPILNCGAILYIIGFLLLLISAAVCKITKDRRIQQNIMRGAFISYVEFLNNWITGRSGNRAVSRYKTSDTSGCYIILIFKNPVRNHNFRNYSDVYVGQSLNICNSVHQHFTGKGNGDIYADIRSSKYVYVRFCACAAEEMNKREKELIDAFNATESYNATKGGGINR